MFPVAYGIIETEPIESWIWFMERLHGVIGHPPGLDVHIDACKGLQNSVDAIFPRVEHTECMRHLSINFIKKFKDKIFEGNLRLTSYTYIASRHDTYMHNMYTHPEVK
jgi:transposase-like protein